jgi:thioredoxin reductase (NADPH)
MELPGKNRMFYYFDYNEIFSDDLFSLDYDPGKTIVVGASYVALECAGFLHGIGREVHIFVRSILLRGFDQQMATKIGDYMTNIGIQFHRQTIPLRVECLEEGKPGKLRLHYQQTLESGEIKEFYEDCNTVLFAIGREACTKELNLEKIGIKVNKFNGFKIKTKEEQSIDVPWLYAVGDCIDEQTMPPGQPLELTPVAIQAGQLLAKRLFSNSTIKVRYKTKTSLKIYRNFSR